MEGNINERLLRVQEALEAPKGQYNSFGSFHYRSCEDILEAVKPLLVKEGLTLTITDEPVMIGDWHYIKASAFLRLGDELVITNAYAREPLEKKGSDQSQISGMASSYARKYALNGMFIIDDAKDADVPQRPEVDKPRYKPIPKQGGKQKQDWAARDELSKAKTTLKEAIKVYAMATNLDKDALMNGVSKREDYAEGKNDPDWFYMVAEEFGYKG